MILKCKHLVFIGENTLKFFNTKEVWTRISAFLYPPMLFIIIVRNRPYTSTGSFKLIYLLIISIAI